MLDKGMITMKGTKRGTINNSSLRGMQSSEGSKLELSRGPAETMPSREQLITATDQSIPVGEEQLKLPKAAT